MNSTLWLLAIAAMLPVMTLVAWLRFADDPTDAAMFALVAQAGPSFTGAGGTAAIEPPLSRPRLTLASVFLLFPSFHNPGLTP